MITLVCRNYFSNFQTLKKNIWIKGETKLNKNSEHKLYKQTMKVGKV